MHPAEQIVLREPINCGKPSSSLPFFKIPQSSVGPVVYPPSNPVASSSFINAKSSPWKYVSSCEAT